MRMRTQAEAIAALRRADPECAITPYALRTMILSGRIPSLMVGRKRLIDLDTLQQYLCAPAPVSEAAPTNNTKER